MNGDFFLDESILNIEIEEEYPGWPMYFDGTLNFHHKRDGVVLISSTGARFPVTTQLSFSCTNNTVEYDTCIIVLVSLV